MGAIRLRVQGFGPFGASSCVLLVDWQIPKFYGNMRLLDPARLRRSRLVPVKCTLRSGPPMDAKAFVR